MRRSGDVEYVKILEDYNGKSRVRLDSTGF